MKIRLRRPRSPPSRIKSWLAGSLNPKKINSPLRRLIKFRHQAFHRQSQLRHPPFSGLIYPHAPPHPAAQIPFFAVSYIQIDPKSIRCNFKLLILSRLLRIGLQKNLANIAIPQFIPPPPQIRICKNRNHPISRQKPQIQIFRRPQQPHLRLALRIRMQSLPVRAKSNWRGRIPCFAERKTSIVRLARQTHRGNCFVVHSPPLFFITSLSLSCRGAARCAPVSQPFDIATNRLRPCPPLPGSTLRITANCLRTPSSRRPRYRQIPVLASISA